MTLAQGPEEPTQVLSADAQRGPGPGPWAWVPSLYLLQGLPYVVVMSLSVVMYKNLGLSNTDIALYTSWLYLPWVIKPLWSPLIELLGTRRRWIWLLQFAVGAMVAMVALSLPTEQWVRWSLALLWLMAFASASHDIAADGYYMMALPTHQQAAFVGIRSTFYRVANIAGQGGLVYLAGEVAERSGSAVLAWQVVLGLLAVCFVVVGLYHAWRLPYPAEDRPGTVRSSLFVEFFAVLGAFFRKPAIAVGIAYLLLYRFPEAQLLKLAAPFLLDPAEAGGLGLSTREVGVAYGTVGLIALTVGGIVGGLLISRFGLKACLWPLVWGMHLPNLVFLAMALWPPQQLWVVSTALAIEQFGYGVGFAAYLMVMILIAEGPHKTAHYAICTGFMAMGMMIPGFWSGWLQEALGYTGFFTWVMVAAIPSFVMTALIRVPEGFGRREPAA